MTLRNLRLPVMRLDEASSNRLLVQYLENKAFAWASNSSHLLASMALGSSFCSTARDQNSTIAFVDVYGDKTQEMKRQLYIYLSTILANGS